MDNEIYIWIAGQLIAAAAIWGGIRIDISHIHKNVERLFKESDKANHRIDRLYERKHQ